MDYFKQNHLSILIILWLVLAPFFGGQTFGALDRTTVGNPWTHSGAVTFSSTATIGTNGSAITELKATTCALIGTDGSQAASTSVPYDCAVTGIASGDVVLAQIATSTDFAGPVFGWDIIAAKASTTAGYVTVLLANKTGAAATPSISGVGSTTNIWYMDN